MRDIYKTAKQSQMAPVRGRVKAMMAQPRAIPQARKIARQTTGFQKGGHVKKVSHDSELTKWFLEKHGGTKKKKPHSTQEGRIAAGKRALWRGVKEKEKRPGPPAPARPKEAGMYVKKGGKVDKKWIQKAVNPKHKGYCTPMTKKTCTPARKRLAKLFKKKARTGWKKANGGTVVMPTVGNDVRTRAYKQGALISPRPRPTTLAHGRMRGVGIAKRGW